MIYSIPYIIIIFILVKDDYPVYAGKNAETLFQTKNARELQTEQSVRGGSLKVLKMRLALLPLLWITKKHL